MGIQENAKEYTPKFGPLGKKIYDRTYSRDKADGTKETWGETVVRAVDGNLALVDKKFIEQGEREELIRLMLDFAIIPGGRHLYMSGVQGRQFLSNCHTAGFDASQPHLHYTFSFDALMQGGGVGANYSCRYLEKMPCVARKIDLHVVCDAAHADIHEFRDKLSSKYRVDQLVKPHMYEVEDSREGWVVAVEKIIRYAYITGSEYYTDGKTVPLVIDVSKIRKRGEPLKTSGGTASGPGPLVDALLAITKVFNRNYGGRLSSLETMTVDHEMAACVVAGGIRRSSRIAVKSWKDPDIFDFINCKRVDGQHWTANISVEVDDQFFLAVKQLNHHAINVLGCVSDGAAENGDPGVWNISKCREGERDPLSMFCCNPCAEINMPAWGACNLGHVSLAHFASKKRSALLEAFRLMSRWLVRATFGDFSTKIQRETVAKERRIGVGFFGYHDWIASRGIKYSDSWASEEVRGMLSSSRDAVVNSATTYAQQLGIPVPVKFTAVAPTGTIANLPGVKPGCQSMMAPWYKRLVRYSDNDPEVARLEKEGYEVFDDPDARNTKIVVFWCEDTLTTTVKAWGYDPKEILEGGHEVSAENCLRVQAMIQEVYADNSVSYTVPIQKDVTTAEQVADLIMEYGPKLKGTTFYPEGSRRNAPFQPVTYEQFQAHTGHKEIADVEVTCAKGCPVR